MYGIYILIGATIGFFTGGVIGALVGAVAGWLFTGWDKLFAKIGWAEENANLKTILVRVSIALFIYLIALYLIPNK